ncbi:propeptide peptidase M4 and M36 [Candidatus Vecturithrix granuli]|uniref:Propeptide peptidase M4 and M36 n=1 Tax=Vecturithrix granuli TaxID=1499967 RepID=A0A081C226_VECG1|nr:propeptide peptidase M4 and M36 [Candidatus Vecturithrix granuli]
MEKNKTEQVQYQGEIETPGDQKPDEGIKEPKKPIEVFKNRLRWSIQPHETLDVYSHIHESIGNVEYLVGPDLAQGKWLSDTPENCARQFLLEQSELFGLLRTEFELRLFRKHVLHSQMGTHCIFGLRYEGKEVEGHSFSVHIDHDMRVVMVTSVYNPNTPEMVVQLLKEIDEAKKIEKFSEENLKEILQSKLPTVKIEKIESMLVERYDEKQNCELRSGWQIKCVSENGGFVMWVTRDKEGKIDYNREPYPVSAKVGQEWVGLGKVFQGFWDGEDSVSVSAIFDRETRSVILRGLKSHNELLGRYVRVRDTLTTRAQGVPSTDTPLNFCPDTDLTTSLFDRVMAYYHIDLIQRFFRELGLDILDDEAYPQFNPMEVILGNTETSYCTNQQRIYFQRRTENYNCTDAREARIVYHEFVHAVTDALARMHRHDTKDKDSLRYRQILEAEAMDEGLADYFACSLAERYGMKCARFYPLRKIVSDENQEYFDLQDYRNVEGVLSGLETYPFGIGNDQLKEMNYGEIKDGLIYSWGERWSRYLWGLRGKLGAEVADMIIAHSIFFLTRWATFGMGILAIMLADRLLFRGVHKGDILPDSKVPKEWSNWDK